MNLHGFVNGAQLPQSPVPKKQQQKQPKTKTADIDTQWQKPLSKHKILVQKPSSANTRTSFFHTFKQPSLRSPTSNNIINTNCAPTREPQQNQATK
jgi:hypothetical protein